MNKAAVSGGSARNWLTGAAALVAFVAALVALVPAPAQAQVAPARPLFLNLELVFTQSAVGKDIRGQLEAMLLEISTREEKAIADLEARQQALMAQQNRPQAELEKEWDNLQAERKGQASLFQLERTTIQGASADARREVNGILNEVMREILRERGANMVLSVQSVLVGGVDYDITPEVIARLDKRLPALKVKRPQR